MCPKTQNTEKEYNNLEDLFSIKLILIPNKHFYKELCLGNQSGIVDVLIF
jgi:hypothetical protein